MNSKYWNILWGMLSWNPRLFQLFGINLYCHVSVFALSLLYLLWSPENFVILCLVYASVIPHEYGHVLAARHCGVGCKFIIMTPLGGMAVLDYMPRSWHKEFWITLWGPLVSLIIAGLFFPIGLLCSHWTHLPLFVAIINVMICFFNLLPIFPLDGDRLLRSLLAKNLSYENATWYAVRTGQIAAVGLAVLGIFLLNFGMIFIAAFAFWFGEIELRRVTEAAKVKS